MKFIKINESQKNRLFEAYREGFSLENLSMMADTAFAMGEDDSNGQMRYCTHWLGYPDNMGSSRAVYTLSDSLVLKLAYGNKYDAGIEQNRVEFEVYQKFDTPLLPKILYHDKNFTFLVCENVVTAKLEDFEQYLGLPFYSYYSQNSKKWTDAASPNKGDLEIGYNKYFHNIRKPFERADDSNLSVRNIIFYLESTYSLDEGGYNRVIEDIIKSNPWLKSLKELMRKTSMIDLSYDFSSGSSILYTQGISTGVLYTTLLGSVSPYTASVCVLDAST